MKTILIGAANPTNGRMMQAIHHAWWRRRSVYMDRVGGDPAPEPMPEYVGFLDDTRFGEFCGLPIFGGLDRIPEFVASGHVFVNTVSGSTLGRYLTSRKVIDAGGQLVDFIHPSINKDFKRGVGTYCQDDVGIQADVEVGDNTAIHARAFISHEVRIGHSCFIGAGVLAGRVVMGDGAYFGINAVVLPDVKVGRWATIGAGAVVLKDVPDGAVMVGNPARVLRINPVPDHGGSMS